MMKRKVEGKEVLIIIVLLVLFAFLFSSLVYLAGDRSPLNRVKAERIGNAQVIYLQDFEDSPVCEQYGMRQVMKDFSIGSMNPEGYSVGLGEYIGSTPWKKDLLRNTYNVSLVDAGNANHCLRIKHEAGKYGIIGVKEGMGSGAKWTARIPGNYEELYLSFKVRRDTGAEAVREAELPCLMGSFTWEDNKGFSASSIMNRKELFGHSWILSLPGKTRIVEPWTDPSTGELFSYQWNDSAWYNLCFRVCVNSAGEEGSEANADGLVEVFINGRLISQITGLALMEKDFHIDRLVMQFYIGGGSQNDAPSTDQHLFIDDICLFTFEGGTAPGLREPSLPGRRLDDLPFIKRDVSASLLQ